MHLLARAVSWLPDPL
ncbi:hypothetical protein, partial [Thermobifida halotolerans]